MKKKRKETKPEPPIWDYKEYCLFHSQPKGVLDSYRTARLSIALILPCFSLLGIFFPRSALALSIAAGIFSYIVLQKKVGKKGAAAPGIVALTGTGIGHFLFSPLLPHGALLQEVFHGF